MKERTIIVFTLLCETVPWALASVAKNGKDGHALEKAGPTFQVISTLR